MRVYEKAEKFAVGQNGNKATKFVEAAKGTNLFFAVFVSEQTNKESGEIVKARSYLTIPLNVMIDCQKKFGSKWQSNIETYLKENKLVSDDVKLLFILSPNDLVYLPTKEELKEGIRVMNRARIYKFVNSGGIQANIIPAYSANILFSINKKAQKERFGSETYFSIQDEYGLGSPQSKNERAITGEMIKEICIPLKVDRLGNTIELNNKKS